MAKISNLFYSSDSEKQTLHKRITPSIEQRQMQQEHWNNLAEYLQADLAETSGYPMSYWIQGSYKFGTQTRPVNPKEEFDIDLGFYFNWVGEPSDGKYSAYEIKTFVQESLNRYASDDIDDVLEVVDPPKKRCSRIRFKENFHIDIPAYHLDEARDARTLATEDNIWEASDPKALYLWFRNQCSSDDDNQIRRLIRYFKIWSALHITNKDERPSTITTTVLITEVFNNLDPEQKDGDDVAFRYLIEKIIERLNNNFEILNPVNESENLNRLEDSVMKLLLIKLNELLILSVNAVNAKSELESAVIWQDVFFHFFPLPITENSNVSNNALTLVQFIPKVLITAIQEDNKKPNFSGVNSIINIPRDCIIKFTLTNFSDIPFGSKVEWIVRNEGQEAEYRNDLGHLAGSGFEAEEHSSYAGTHYMDVIVKSPINQIVGFLRIPVHVSAIFMPKRNPIKKSWNGRLPRK